MVVCAHHRRLFAARRKRRRHHFREMGADRVGGVARGNGSDLYRAFGLAERDGFTADSDDLVGINRRFRWWWIFGWTGIHKFKRESSCPRHVDLADRFAKLVDRLTLFAAFEAFLIAHS